MWIGLSLNETPNTNGFSYKGDALSNYVTFVKQSEQNMLNQFSINNIITINTYITLQHSINAHNTYTVQQGIYGAMNND